jgi:hypothetical protein
VLLLLAALAGAGLAVRSARNSAGQQRTVNVSERLAAQSTALEAADPVTAALLAGAAWRIAPTAQARYSLLQSLTQPVRGILAAQALPGVTSGRSAAFSPDGGTLATAGANGSSSGSIRLWDVATQQEIGTSMTADPEPVYALAFSPDGATLATAGGDGRARVWNVAFPGGAALLAAACAIADQSLTLKQWADYAGTQPFQQVCPAS